MAQSYRRSHPFCIPIISRLATVLALLTRDGDVFEVHRASCSSQEVSGILVSTLACTWTTLSAAIMTWFCLEILSPLYCTRCGLAIVICDNAKLFA